MFNEQVFHIAYNLRCRNFSLRQIQDLLQIGKSTLHRWFTKTQRTHTYVRNKSNSLSEKEHILDICSKYPYFSIRRLVNVINNLLQLNWSFSTLYRFMIVNDLKYSKVYPIGNGNHESITLKRKLFSDVVKTIDMTKVLCIDETAIYSKIHYKYAWSKKSIRPHLPYQRVVSNRRTFTVCFSINNMIHYECSPNNMNQQSFLTFLDNVLTLSDGKYKYILMDNVAFHKTKKVQDLLKLNGVLPLYTSPYSPEWNPVEMFFSYIKRTKKYIDNRFKCLNEQLNYLISTIDNSLYSNWYRHVQKNILNNFHR